MPAGFKSTRRLVAFLICIVATGPSSLAQLSFTKLEKITERETRVQLTIPAGTRAKLDVSENLIDWQAFLTAPAGSLTHTDWVAVAAPARFFRAADVPAASVTGDFIPTTAGDLLIHPVTHASFVITWNGKTIYNDPTPGSYTGIPKGDLMLVSHSHSDHFDSATLTTYKATGGIIIAPQAVYNAMSSALRAATTVLDNGESTTVFSDILVEAVPAYNSNHPRGAGNGYVVTLGGKRLYMSGDTGDIAETRALTNIDIAFLCVNVPYTMTVAQAASVIRAFQPKIVYPYHFRNQDGTYSNLNTLKSTVGTDLPIEVRLRKWY